MCLQENIRKDMKLSKTSVSLFKHYMFRLYINYQLDALIIIYS